MIICRIFHTDNFVVIPNIKTCYLKRFFLLNKNKIKITKYNSTTFRVEKCYCNMKVKLFSSLKLKKNVYKQKKVKEKKTSIY